MYGATRRKRTKLLCNHQCFQPLELECDNNHQHDAWGVAPTGGWATAAEVEYPYQLCQAWAACLRRCLIQHGAVEPLQELTNGDTIPLVQASKAATGVQPRGKKLQPLMREYSHFITLRGPHAGLSALPIKCSTAITIPSTCSTTPMCPALPQHAKRIKPPYQVGEKAELDKWEVIYGVSWTPDAFIKRAAGRSHPGHFLDGVHPVLKEMFANGLHHTTQSRAQDRSEQMRKWVTRAKELTDGCEDGKLNSPEHARKIIAKKNLRLLQEMVKESGSPDVNIASDIAKGFNLMGEIPSGSIYPAKYMHATLLPDQVREMAGLGRSAIWESTKKVSDHDISSEVYKITMEERDKGWLRGPFELGELPANAVLTRRFGVKQSSTLSDGSRTMKVRPIDDYSESLVNATNSCGEAIQPMSVDAILATLVYRDQMWGSDRLVGKTIDLRKAYKNLPISVDSLEDAYLCVYSPVAGKPQAFQTLVLPFGARAAVMGFCRTSYALWRIGVTLFQMHWTVFFDDYYLVASEHEARHVDLAQELIFRLLGWETSSEKEAGFRAIAKILGVQIDLNESLLGKFSVCNVESRVSEMVTAIDAVLDRGTLSAAEMRILRGRLIFAEAQIYGRLSGLHMQNLGRWEHAIGDTLIDEDLRRSLEFVRDRVLKGGPRVVESAVGDVYHLYTDACFEKGAGGLGGVLYNQHGKMLSFFSERVNPDLVDKLNPLGKETIIFELEALAACIGCSVLLQPAAVRSSDRVVLFLDNDAVLGRIISGKSGLGLDGCIIQNILEWEESIGAVVWYERVPSAANISDDPSRGELLGFDPNLRVGICVPDLVNEIIPNMSG